jgi:hypothetical protein
MNPIRGAVRPGYGLCVKCMPTLADTREMTITRYRSHVACLLAGLTVGVVIPSIVGSGDAGHGLAAKSCVHITSAATVCGRDAKRVCNSTLVRVTQRLAILDGDKLTDTQALQAEECRKV